MADNIYANVGEYGILPDGSYGYNPLVKAGKATDMYAQVTRAVYDDWKQNYLPVALEMMNQTTYNNPGLMAENVTQAVGNVNSSFNSAQDQQDRTLSRFGISRTGQAQEVSDRMESLSKSASIVDAANRIRQNLADRNRQVALGGIPNLAGKTYGGNE